MGLFDVFKKKEAASDWDKAYKANPSFYSKPDGSPFCAFALTEGTDTVLPKAPAFAVQGKDVKEYKLMLVSTTKDGILGDCDYFEAIKKLEVYKVAEDNDRLLIKGLSLEELEEILK